MQQELNKNICLKDTTEDKLFGMPDEYDFSKFNNVEGFSLDDELKEKFQPIARKLNLSQESVEMLLDIALQMSLKQKTMYDKEFLDNYDEKVASYNEMLSKDTEIPDKNSYSYKNFIKTANEAYTKFCSPELKQIFKESGLVYHPELIKMFHTIGELAQEDDLSYGGKPSWEELTPAQILYGQSENS